MESDAIHNRHAYIRTDWDAVVLDKAESAEQLHIDWFGAEGSEDVFLYTLHKSDSVCTLIADVGLAQPTRSALVASWLMRPT